MDNFQPTQKTSLFMNNLVCPICQRTDHIKVLEQKAGGVKKSGAWICNNCCHAWRPEPWANTCQKEFFEKASYTNPEFEQRWVETNKRMFERFEEIASSKISRGNRLMVDFGCSYGTCMQVFKSRNWSVMGIEVSPTSQKILDQRKLPWARSMEESEISPGTVDVFIVADCLYYIPTPIEVLQSLVLFMRPDGIIILRQSTRGGLVSLLANISEKRALSKGLWLDHVHLFSRRSTTLALHRVGLYDICFLPERGFQHSLKGKFIHGLLKVTDILTLRRLDITPSWTVLAGKVR